MARAYIVTGTTDEVTTCELCGRQELKGTVVMQPLDADGNADGHPAYFGTSCAATAAGWTQREATRRIKVVVDAERARKSAEFWRARRADEKWLEQWFVQRYGTPSRRRAAEIAGEPWSVLFDRAVSDLRDHRATVTPH